MRTEDFIYKNIAKLLASEFPKCRPGIIAMAAKAGKNHYMKGGNFKEKAFDACYKEAVRDLKQSVKFKL